MFKTLEEARANAQACTDVHITGWLPTLMAVKRGNRVRFYSWQWRAEGDLEEFIDYGLDFTNVMLEQVKR